MKEYTSATLEEFITAVRNLIIDFHHPNLWWRGQADSKWPLTPGVFRPGYEKNEQNLSFFFRLKAKSRSANCPASDTQSPWLFLMQHYGMPTRLLDWTESPLIALYFAVENEKENEKDAVIYALQPFNLNFKQCKIESILAPWHPEIAPIFNEAFNKNETNPDQRIAAIQTDQFDVRHLVQQSEFTIHGSAKAMEELDGCDNFLGKIVIPSTAKEHLRVMLKVLGITRANLFPDLENLSAELITLHREKQSEGSESAEIPHGSHH